ncbi:MAG: peptidase M48 [Alphaproteobacteria bacterium CG_4_10_14_0_2_um_filter_63_37]|nr:MAG: peptidase M48 [Alphaproteobacteria bacterium CG_4_10_14_0_2_um_filter_63_37]
MGDWRGIYYDGHTSQQVEVDLAVSEGMLVLTVGAQPLTRHPLEQVTFQTPIGGRGVWRIDLPGGGCCETRQPPPIGLDHDWVAPLERRWPVALAALALTVLLSWAMVAWGIPALADRAARLLPTEVTQGIGDQSLALIDRMLPPTNLPPSRQNHLQQLLDRVATTLAMPPMRLVCRRGGNLGANALALPSGIVVVTDELNTLARSDEELMAVLAHEAGHVQGRHTLRSILQNSAAALFLASLTGDWNGLAALGAALPTALFNAQYSQQFEREADRTSLDFLRREQISPQVFADILGRIEKSGHHGKDPAPFLSTHPPTDERLESFRPLPPATPQSGD